MNEHDHMELGDSGFVPMEDGWVKNVKTGVTIAPDGRVFNEKGDLIEDPEED